MNKTATLTALTAIISTLPAINSNDNERKTPSNPHKPDVEVIEILQPMLIKGERLEIFNIESIEITQPMLIKPSVAYVTNDSDDNERFDDNGTANKEMLNQVHDIIWPQL